jgi:hypothetical protein
MLMVAAGMSLVLPFTSRRHLVFHGVEAHLARPLPHPGELRTIEPVLDLAPLRHGMVVPVFLPASSLLLETICFTVELPG